MTVSREEMKEEALKRMKALRMMAQPIKEFSKENKLNLSEVCGILYWLDEEQERMIRDWEMESGNLAYHIIHSFAEFGELFTVLYVSKHKEEWDYDNKDLKQGFPCCYVINKDIPEFSEYGSCEVQPINVGVMRIC